jgi:hypothetical protein
MIAELETVIRERLGAAIYGADEETLEATVARKLMEKGWRLAVVEYGLGGQLLRRLAALPPESLAGGQMLTEQPEQNQRTSIVENYRKACAAEAAIGVFLTPAGDKQDIYIVMITPNGIEEYARPYGGPPGSGPAWGTNHSLDILRKF